MHYSLLPGILKIITGYHTFKVDSNQLLRTSIRTEPVRKSAISFLKLNEISRGKVHISRNNTLALNCYSFASLMCSII